MKKIVADTNKIFSALLKENNSFRDILLSNENQIFAPTKLFYELNKHKKKILKYTKIEKDKFDILFHEIIKDINFIDERIIPMEIYQTAYQLCYEYDADDTPFVALTLYLDAKFWTGDKIKEHLRKKGFDNFF